MRNTKAYIKMYKMGTSISFKKVKEEYGGDLEMAGGFAKNTKGWWWADPDAKITQKELDEAKPSIINHIVAIMDGMLDEGRVKGLRSPNKAHAYITWDKFGQLF